MTTNRLAGFLGVLAIIAIAPAARADYNISVNGVNCTSGTSATANVTADCLSVTPSSGVTLSIISTQGTDTPGEADQNSSDVSTKNTSSSVATITLLLGISNFTSPTTPPNVLDSSSITLNGGSSTNAGVKVTGTSCVQTNNSLAVTAAQFCTSPAPGEAGPNAAVSVAGSTTAGNTTNGTITSLNSPFSLEQELVIVLQPNSSANFTFNQSLISSVPEPSAIVLLGTVLVGFATMFRKKIARQS